MIRQLPNAITATRGLCGPVVMYLVTVHQANFVAFWVFVFAILTDLVDGYVARRLNAISPIAVLLDPLADKLLTDFAWVALAWVAHAPVWLSVAFVGRDLLVGGLWFAFRSHRPRWGPRPIGQISVAFEGVAVAVLLFHGPWLDVHWPSVGTVLGVVALTLSVIQLLDYAGGRNPGPAAKSANP